MKVITPTLLFCSLVLVLSGCYSIRKNERHVPVYKRKEVLPVYTEQKPTAAVANAVESAPSPAPVAEPAPVQDPKAAAVVQLETEPPVASLPQERIHRMVHESKMEIIASGMSAEYVEAHFTVAEMVDEANEKKVIWNYSLGEYKIEVVDQITWTQDASGNIQYTHAIRQEWGNTHNIEKVISQAEADQAMRNCIGEFTEVSFRFTAFDLPGSASPWMIAKSTQPAPGGSAEDKIFLQGFINLETGACQKEIAGVIHAPMEEK